MPAAGSVRGRTAETRKLLVWQRWSGTVGVLPPPGEMFEAGTDQFCIGQGDLEGGDADPCPWHLSAPCAGFFAARACGSASGFSVGVAAVGRGQGVLFRFFRGAGLLMGLAPWRRSRWRDTMEQPDPWKSRFGSASPLGVLGEISVTCVIRLVTRGGFFQKCGRRVPAGRGGQGNGRT